MYRDMSYTFKVGDKVIVQSDHGLICGRMCHHILIGTEITLVREGDKPNMFRTSIGRSISTFDLIYIPIEFYR